MSLIEAIIVLSFITYRITRLVLDDGIVKTQRSWFLKRLLADQYVLDYTTKGEEVVPDAQAEADGKIAAWRLKLYELFTCPYCMSVWIGLFTTIAVALTWSVPKPFWLWLAICGSTMLVWKVTEE